MSKPQAQRQSKTPQQRAEEALGVAQRLVERLEAQQAKHRKALTDLAPEVDAAVARRDYLAAHPDLPGNGADVPLPIEPDA